MLPSLSSSYRSSNRLSPNDHCSNLFCIPQQHPISYIWHFLDFREIMQAQAARSCLELKEDLLRRPHGPVKSTAKVPSFGFGCPPASRAPLLLGTFIADLRFQPDGDVHISQSFSVSQHTAEQNNSFHTVRVRLRAVDAMNSLRGIAPGPVPQLAGEWGAPRMHLLRPARSK